jgi:hypothetical protein
MANVASTCFPYGDRGFSVPLVLTNSLDDSVHAVLRAFRYDRELPDSATLLATWLAPGEKRPTELCFGAFMLTGHGVPTSRPYVLSISTRERFVWRAQLSSSWIDSTELRVVIGGEGPPAELHPPVREPSPGYRGHGC